MTLLRTRELTVDIADVHICRDLNLSVGAGERWALLGRNGVGKTTLLHTLAGLNPPLSGEVLVQERPLQRWGRRRLAQQLGLLPQDNQDPFPATVLETALMGRHPHISPWRWEDEDDQRIALDALAELDLQTLTHRDVGTLSGGERRRVAVATLLTQNPRLMLLDEPSNHLDVHHQIDVLERLDHHAGNGAMILATHDVNLALRFCTHALLLFGDGESCHGPVETMLERDVLASLYRHPMQAARTEDGRRIFVPA